MFPEGGQQGSVLGFEIEASRGSYHTQLVKVEDAVDLDGSAKAQYGGLMKANLFTLKIPKVDGGSKLSVKARWSQKLLYRDDQFWFSVPFNFPVHVTPPGKLPKREKILLNELSHQFGKRGYLYAAEVSTWSHSNFEFSYSISFSEICGGLLLQQPPLNDFDQREMFALYLFPGDSHIRKKEAYDKTSLRKMVSSLKMFPLPSLGIGFGDLEKTAKNLPPGVTVKEPDATQLILNTASSCCSQLLDPICCMCFIQACSKLSDQCVITLSQLCAALSCFECVNCCYDLCFNCG